MPDQLEDALTTLEALHRAHHERAVRVARLLAYAAREPSDSPIWAEIERQTAAMESLNAMIQVCPDEVLSAHPPTSSLH
mgnify:CR=1 FL=1